MGASISAVSDVVIGRKLWSEWRDYWTSSAADDPFGEFINPIPNHVVSSTLTGELDWNSTLLDGDTIDYVNRLEACEGGDIHVAGGVGTVRSTCPDGAGRKRDRWGEGEAVTGNS